MRSWVVAALLVSGGVAHGQSLAQKVWTIPWGTRDGQVRGDAPDLPTNGRLEVIGVQSGEFLVRDLAGRSPALVGGGERVPLDIAEYPHVGDGYTEAVLVPSRPLRPRTIYRLSVAPSVPSCAAERDVLAIVEEPSYLTGAGPAGAAPAWTGEPSLGAERRVDTASGSERRFSVHLPSASPVPFARVTVVCPGGAMRETRTYPVSASTAEIPAAGCASAGGANPAAAIVELLDGDGNVSRPRRVALAAAARAQAAAVPRAPALEPRVAAPPRSGAGAAPSWPVGLLGFALAPFAAGYAIASLLLRRRRH